MMMVMITMVMMMITKLPPSVTTTPYLHTDTLGLSAYTSSGRILLGTSRPLTDEVEIRRADSHGFAPPASRRRLIVLGLHDGVREKAGGVMEWMGLTATVPPSDRGKSGESGEHHVWWSGSLDAGRCALWRHSLG